LGDHFVSKKTACKKAFRLLQLLLSALVAMGMATPPNAGAGSFAGAPHATAGRDRFAQVNRAMQQAMDEHQLPGAVIEVGHAGRVVLTRAYGERSLVPTREAMTVDTVFDMASLTKPMITALAIMQLLEAGKLRLADPAALYLPAFGAAGKADITLRQLLTHYSGLPPDLDLSFPWTGKEEGFRRANAISTESPAGAVFRYSDVNYIVLQEIVEKLSGEPLQVYAQTHILGPLRMTHSGFLPDANRLPPIAPTAYDENRTMLRGTVHDPTARRMGGVAGHAGFFSTAHDISLYAQALLDRRRGKPSRFPLGRAALLKMTTPEEPVSGTQVRGLGWDIDSVFSGNRGDLFALGSFGHTGFTGTSLWMDPASDTFLILLSNAVHPSGVHNITPLRGRIANIIVSALNLYATPGSKPLSLSGYNQDRPVVPARNGDVLTGIDVLEASHFAQLRPLLASHGGHLRVGLVTNQTGLDREDRRTIDILRAASSQLPGLMLTTLFSPEHGIHGTADSTNVTNDQDAATGLPVVSLYGTADAQRRPTPAQMQSLDAIVFDLQDAGVRFYTYETLLGYFLEAAAKAGVVVIVLDRPNPITGVHVEGPLSDAGQQSYTNYIALPVRHGMTLGELARYDNAENQLHASLRVIAMQGWQRGDWFDDTGLLWIDPSPNLRSMTAAVLYPGLGLIESTNVSVGRGTDRPFELVGAAWIKPDGEQPRSLARYLNARLLPGVRFMPARFTPHGNYPFSGLECGGVDVLVLNRNLVDAPELGLEIASALRSLYPANFQPEKIARALVNQQAMEAWNAGTDPRAIEENWRAALEAFVKMRQQFLLY
jgi:uncharacterized protein YbbC (DUF1343 family)/CubicO group peptidase (beta-lactamase class C family)